MSPPSEETGHFCPISGHAVTAIPWEPPNNPRFECPVCGKYRLSEYAAQRLFEVVRAGGHARPQVAADAYLLSAVIRERYEEGGQREVFIRDLAEIRAAARPLADPFESVDRILLHAVRSARRAGDEVPLQLATDYPIAYARDATEFDYFVRLGVQLGLLTAQGESPVRIQMSPDGWRRLRELQRVQPNLRQAFVAMAFSEELRAAFVDAIDPALRATGYEVVRVDGIEHNEKIDDRIVAEIRKSAIVVAHFTRQRQNVYFEAGFALGLGQPVIWTCRSRTSPWLTSTRGSTTISSGETSGTYAIASRTESKPRT